ncbi:hypothetical protein TRIP_C20235 [Candidatus Zixiibacteriota bacterium]|nr:hypothetical protein TRIP_C20235 [candidate division Zixibacteria bacterium]
MIKNVQYNIIIMRNLIGANNNLIVENLGPNCQPGNSDLNPFISNKIRAG